MRVAHALAPVLALALAGLPSPARAQTLAGLASRCGHASGGAAWCALGAAAYGAVAAGVGLATSGGGDIPGTSSTLGRRGGRGSRIAVSARLNAARVPLPAIEGASSPPPVLRSLVSVASLEAAVGLFDGVRAAPRHGGILALDAIASVGIVRLPRGDGFQGNVPTAGLGVRLGLLRESFGVPGISVSAMHRFIGEARVGADDAPVALGVRPAATSVRAMIGKDLAVAGVLFGAGWDRYSGHADLEGPFPAGGIRGLSLAGPAVRRLLFFGAVARTWQVFRGTAELGWASGFDESWDSATMPFHSGAGSVFGSVSLRVTR